MTELCDLGDKFHTDKGPSANPLAHNYTPFYHELLKDKRETVKNVLEIGIGWSGLFHSQYQAGGSLFMWREYFPKAKIYGADIRPDVLFSLDRICCFQCDQSNKESLVSLMHHFVCKRIDLIIDDGSHVKEDQVLTAKILVPLLAPGGLYVIEDVHDTELEFVRTHLGFKHEVIECPNEKLTGDRLIVIREE